MRTSIPVFLALLIGLFVPAAGQADPIVSIIPSFQSGNIGDTFIVGVNVALSPGEEIGSFDLDVLFNSSVLSLVDAVLGSGLGTGVNQIEIASGLLGSAVDLAQVSLLNEATLQSLQGSSFSLATLTFQAIAEGFSALTITQAILADGNLNTTQLPVTLQHGGIQIGTTPIPEPGTWVLMSVGLGLTILLRRRRK
jgi:hypothetical protein